MRHADMARSLAALFLVLALTGTVAAPAVAAQDPEVRVTASYEPALQVTFPEDIALGEIQTIPYASGPLELTFTVTSNARFSTTLTVADYSTGGLKLTEWPYVTLLYVSDLTPGAETSFPLHHGQTYDAEIEAEAGQNLVITRAVALLIDPDPGMVAPKAIQPGTLDVGLTFTVAQTL
jgi:hypothetical protein